MVTSDALPVIIQREAPDAILVAIPSASPTTVRTIVRVLEPYKVPIQTLPSLRDVMGGRATTQQVRALIVEICSTGSPVGVDMALASRLIRGRRVLVTGAGGSIGTGTEPADRDAESGRPRACWTATRTASMVCTSSSRRVKGTVRPLRRSGDALRRRPDELRDA